MADYHSPTVITPSLPLNDITPLERIILEAVFDAEFDDDHVYFFSCLGPSDQISVYRGELLGAVGESVTTAGSTAAAYIAEKLRREASAAEPDDYVDIDMSDTSWEFILQDIVKRSAVLDEIVVTTSFTCTRMRPDGFGGSVTRITADGISGKSTADMLADLRSDTTSAALWDGRLVRPAIVAGSRRADPIARMLLTIDEQIQDADPIADYVLDSTGNNSLDRIRAFVASFEHRANPYPVATRAELEAILCVWEAMLELRVTYEVNSGPSPNIKALMEVWNELGSVRMRQFTVAIADLALAVYEDLENDVQENFWSFDLDFIPAVVENLDWSIDGPERHGEPELFLAAVLDTMRRSASKP